MSGFLHRVPPAQRQMDNHGEQWQSPHRALPRDPQPMDINYGFNYPRSRRSFVDGSALEPEGRYGSRQLPLDDEVLSESAHTEFQEQKEDEYPLAEVETYDPPHRPVLGRLAVKEDSFLQWFPPGDAAISYIDDQGQMASIPDINIWLVEARSPLLYMAFDQARNGRPHLHLETLTSTCALPFVRYLYTGSYALASATGDLYEDVPTSVLLHCQLYRLGDIFDLADLRMQAYVNIIRQCEFGCSSPEKPIHVWSAVRYLFEHLPKHEKVIEAILNYCISCFSSHRLAEDNEFRQLAYELRPFHQRLCWLATERGRDDADAATAIIQMPFQPHRPKRYASREEPDNPRLKDIVYHFHGEDEADVLSRKRRRAEPVAGPSRVSNLTLALRPKAGTPTLAPKRSSEESSSSSEDEGFKLVRKRDPVPQAETPGSEFEVLSAPESVRAVSSNDASDTETLGGGHKPASRPSKYTLPVHSRKTAPAAGDDSDSDWSLI